MCLRVAVRVCFLCVCASWLISAVQRNSMAAKERRLFLPGTGGDLKKSILKVRFEKSESGAMPTCSLVPAHGYTGAWQCPASILYDTRQEPAVCCEVAVALSKSLRRVTIVALVFNHCKTHEAKFCWSVGKARRVCMVTLCVSISIIH